MTAVTPTASNHAHLPPLASRFVDVAALPWEKGRFPGCETKTLLIDRASGLLTMLLRMAPGAKLPAHEHVLIEQTYVLEGSLVCGEGECKAGDFVWRPAGSRHEAWAGAQGGLMLGLFQIPNRFFEPDGRTLDAVGNDWEQTWGAVLSSRERMEFV
jgi:anti-sigma factor ChrR (cupin superfamily)